MKENELFPVQISIQSYHYVKKILKEESDKKKYKVIIQTPKSTFGIRTDIVIHQSIGYLVSVIQIFFCRIHRSYIIN